MSEKEPTIHEQAKDSIDRIDDIKHIESREKHTPKAEAEQREESAEKARESINELAKNVEEISDADDLINGESKDDDIRWNSRELMGQTYQRTITAVRNRLPKTDRAFSKVIHRGAVEKGSEIIGATAARPSGILFGGIFSLIGSLAGYLIARRLGGELPYSIFAVMFAGGFFIGLLVELSWRFVRSKKLK